MDVDLGKDCRHCTERYAPWADPHQCEFVNVGRRAVYTSSMSFGEAIQTVLRKYAEFDGRAGRPEFWWWTLFNVLVLSALNVLNVFPVGENAYLGSVLAGIWSVGVLLPNLAVAVRRLRDAGHGWGNIFWLLVPIAGIIVLVIYWTQPTQPAPTAAPATAPMVPPAPPSPPAPPAPSN